MNFDEEIKVVLNKMVVPEYDSLDRVEFKKYGDVGKKRFYEIIYVIKKGRFIKKDMMRTIILDTQSIVKMCGIKVYEDYSVQFSNGKKKFYHFK